MSEESVTSLQAFIHAPGARVEASAPDIRPTNAALFDAQSRPLLVSCAGLLPSMAGALAAVRAFFGERWSDRDVAITNDIDAGAVNACDLVAVAPIYADAVLLGWSVVRGSIPDFGGWEPGGYSPQAVDRWAEGARLEPAKLTLAGAYRREVADLLRLNSRTPATTLAHARLLADAALSLGKSYGDDHVKFSRAIADLRAAEDRELAAAFGRLPAAATRQAEIVVPWSNEQFGDIKVRTEKAGGRLRLALAGPPIAKRPLNLGRFAAQDIAAAVVACACGLEDLVTDALMRRLDVTLNEPSLIAAPLPATAGLGRQTSGQILFRTMAEALDVPAQRIEVGWQRYRERACGIGFDSRSGKLAPENSARIRARQLKEVSA